MKPVDLCVTIRIIRSDIIRSDIIRLIYNTYIKDLFLIIIFMRRKTQQYKVILLTCRYR